MAYVVGHRGAAGVMPENTLKGFRYAIDLGVDYVECDVHLTRDGHLVVIHDETVDRTTNGTGRVRDLDLAAIRSLDAGEGERIPTLDEVLDTIRGRTKLLCELKGEGVEDAAVDAVLARDMAADVIFTSFHMDRIARVKRRDGRLRVGAIFWDPEEEDIRRAADLGACGVGIHYRNLCLRLVDVAHDLGLDVRAWNPDTLHEQQAMIALGADGVSTNRPDILLRYLREQGMRG
ncbi:MAG TPA: glycerophosphodiester phosphodiesterase [Caldilineae bacterium]|nr:glycerophosphodiester phosphodiesterase [Caldilineae bacterium]